MEPQNLSRLILEKDEDFEMDVTVRDPVTKLPIDISLATFQAAFNTVLDTETGGTAITVAHVSLGIFRVTIPRATINTLDVKLNYFFNVFMLLGSTKYKMVKGQFQVSGRALSP